MWRNVRTATLNATLQLLVIYRYRLGESLPIQYHDDGHLLIPNSTIVRKLDMICLSNRKGCWNSTIHVVPFFRNWEYTTFLVSRPGINLCMYEILPNAFHFNFFFCWTKLLIYGPSGLNSYQNSLPTKDKKKIKNFTSAIWKNSTFGKSHRLKENCYIYNIFKIKL